MNCEGCVTFGAAYESVLCPPRLILSGEGRHHGRCGSALLETPERAMSHDSG